MSVIVPFIQYVSQPVVSLTRIFAEALAAMDHRSPGEEESAAAAFAMSSGLVGLFCVYWACWMHARLGNFRIAAGQDQARAEAATRFRDALLNQAGPSIVVLRSGEREPQHFGDTHALLLAARKGPDGPALATALEELVEQGTAFELCVHTPDSRTLAIRGLLVGGRAVLYFQEEDSTPDFRAILDEAETRLGLERDAQADMIERFSTAIAVFDSSRRLVRYNSAYAGLWGLAGSWLESRPCQDEILDRLRDSRKLPEQRNFAGWKQDQAQLFNGLKHPVESFWHLPGGKSLRVTVRPHLLGGIFIQFEDVTEKLRLEAAVRLLTQVQRATLDSIDAGMAIFGTDGRLAMHNSQFTKMWRLTEDELSVQPHFAHIANLCTARIGRDGIWGIVSWGVNSAAPESLTEWGKVRRADGRLISLALSRLPNGTTIVTFTDLTDLERFSAERSDPGHAAHHAVKYAAV